MSESEELKAIVQRVVSMQLGLLEALLRKCGNCEREMELLAKAPEFEGKRIALVVLEGARYMHARLYATAPILEAGRPDEVAAALVQVCALKLDDALAPLVAADLVSEFAAKYVVTALRDQIAIRDEAASTRLETPRVLGAIAALAASLDPEMPGPTFTESEPGGMC
jgi:hypothetical protein